MILPSSPDTIEVLKQSIQDCISELTSLGGTLDFAMQAVRNQALREAAVICYTQGFDNDIQPAWRDCALTCQEKILDLIKE